MKSTPRTLIFACPSLHVLADLRARLLVKQQRERAYLERRAACDLHTPTDDAYAADQCLETDLLRLLDRLVAHMVAEPHE